MPLLRFAPEGSSLRHIAERWRFSLGAQSERLEAGRLYVGRSMLEARSVAQRLGAELFMVSAGIGLVRSDEPIPGYDLSASGKGTELAATLARLGASKSDWWGLLVSGEGLGWLLREQRDATVLLSLPSEYLDMVREDLCAISTKDLLRLRVFTSPAGRERLRQVNGLQVLPYDERLESIAGYAGTRTDFPQRALKHFVFALNGHLLPIEEAYRAVSEALGNFRHKAVPNRRRLDDTEIRRLIHQAWDRVGGNSAKLLRYLRDEELVACEQGRFSRLRRQVEAEVREVATFAEFQS